MYIQFLSRTGRVHPNKYSIGMGGSETALYQIARHLAKRGHEVRVVSDLSGFPEGVYDGVRYTPWVSGACDALVYFRESFPLAHPISVRKRIWFTTDAYLVGDNWAETLWPKVDAGVCLSSFHQADLLGRYGAALPPLTIIPLGCDPDETQHRMKVPNRLIYCSEPARGLETLLRSWPRIRLYVPDATLIVTFDYRLWNSDPRIQPYRALANQPGIDYVGMLPRAELLQAQAEAVAHIYPCTFHENFCLASLECQLQGTPTFGTLVGALPTTIGFGGGAANDPIRYVIDYLQAPPARQLNLQAMARQHALSLTWEHTAEAWERFLS